MELNKKHVIVEVEADSIGEELDIEKGDFLLEINGKKVEDALDYHLMAEEVYLEVLIEKGSNGEQWLLEIDKDPEEHLGLVFESELMDCYKSCTNKCMFCFIDQLPEGMRETLYFKDDDARLSFLQGNYITMTNMKDGDVDRIIRYNLTPINISIHTMNFELRKKMLSNRFADRVKIYMDKLNQHGIIMNGQIVLCKGVNDGEELDYSIKALEPYLPNMQSLSIVPVGLSKFREGLYPLDPFTKEDCLSIIETVEKWQKYYYEKYDLHFAQLSDEFYLVAEKDLPEEANYDGYLQLENGVGMGRVFIDSFNQALDASQVTGLTGEVSIVTGTLFESHLQGLVNRFMQQYPETLVTVKAIRNDFFGHNITVSGLLTGQDIIKQLKETGVSNKVIMPHNVLKSDESVLLDDVTLKDIETELNVEIQIVEDVNGQEFYNQLVEFLKV